MPAYNSISADKLVRLIGTPNCPTIIDVRPDGDGLIPSSIRYPAEDVAQWAGDLQAKSVVVACIHGGSRSEGVAAWLRSQGIAAEVLEGGFEAWAAAGLPVVPAAVLPNRDAQGRTFGSPAPDLRSTASPARG